jgi:muramoyltetrapeptide carboxypeptidase
MNSILKTGDAIGIIACSDGRFKSNAVYYQQLEELLIQLGLTPVFANTLYRLDETPFSGTPEVRANELMKLFTDVNVKAIFDISGGDTANQILPFLDYPMIQNHPKPFFGISDLSVLLNALYARSNLTTYHFQLSTITNEIHQQQLFNQLFLNQTPSFITFDYRFLRGTILKGIVIGGNIRCFLKLAGTAYMPDPTDKILFLESLGGGPARIASLLAQLEQLDFFHKCNGVLLGTFTQMEQEALKPSVETLVLSITSKYNLTVVKTNQLGHGINAHCIPIGQWLELN